MCNSVGLAIGDPSKTDLWNCPGLNRMMRKEWHEIRQVAHLSKCLSIEYIHHLYPSLSIDH